MDRHISQDDVLKDLVVHQEDSDTETDEELAQKAAEDHEIHRQLFADVVSRTVSGFQLCADESDFRPESRHSFDAHSALANQPSDLRDERNGSFYPSGIQRSLELDEETEVYSGPDEWRHVWEWEVGECNRMIAEQNTHQYDAVEVCSESGESAEDMVVFECGDEGDDSREHPFVLRMSHAELTHVGDTGDVASAVSSSVVVNELLFNTPSLSTANVVCGRDRIENEAIQSALDDVVLSCIREEVTWDSGDESGLTELDRQKANTELFSGPAEWRHAWDWEVGEHTVVEQNMQQDDEAEVSDTQLAQDFPSHTSQGRVLSSCFPMAGSLREHQDCADTEDSCVDASFISSFAASSSYGQRFTYSSGAHGRSVDSAWNPPHTSPTADGDSCRWKTRKPWRKNSAGNALCLELFSASEICQCRHLLYMQCLFLIPYVVVVF